MPVFYRKNTCYLEKSATCSILCFGESTVSSGHDQALFPGSHRPSRRPGPGNSGPSCPVTPS